MKGPVEVKIDLEQVAVIVAKGNIIQGDHPPGAIGGDSLTELIEEAGDNPLVKALVMRIDTGGDRLKPQRKFDSLYLNCKKMEFPLLSQWGKLRPLEAIGSQARQIR